MLHSLICPFLISVQPVEKRLVLLALELSAAFIRLISGLTESATNETILNAFNSVNQIILDVDVSAVSVSTVIR